MKNILMLLLLLLVVFSCKDRLHDELGDAKPTIDMSVDTVRAFGGEEVLFNFIVKSDVGLQSVAYYHVVNGAESLCGNQITSFVNKNRYTVNDYKYTVPTGATQFSIVATDVQGEIGRRNITILNPDTVTPEPENALAFPGAEGFAAATTTGGRGGSIYYVTNLNDAGIGSLRDAVSSSNRIILFKVSGIIALNSTLEIKGSNLTIAGQTAPGDGVCLKNYSVVVKASNVVIRYMRFRMGDEKGTADDALWGREQSNIVIDHCSMSWCTDECSSFYDNTNFTMQWCILSESLRISKHDKGAHGYGGIWGGKGASFHHNLLAHHDSRNPRFCGSRYSKRPDLEKCDFRNNVVYNWGANSGYAGEGGQYNFVNNYYKAGTGSSNKSRIFSPNGQDQTKTSEQSGNVWGQFWLSGNYVDAYSNVTSDNWQGLQPNATSGSPLPSGGVESLKLSAAFDVPNQTTHTSLVAYNKVLAYAGASLKRDATDVRVSTEVANGSAPVRAYYSVEPLRALPGGVSSRTRAGMIDSQADVGGWDTYNSAAAPTDSDGDGIPDDWEIAQGLNPNSAADGKLKTLSTIYTNVEVYINSLVQAITEAQQ